MIKAVLFLVVKKFKFNEFSFLPQINSKFFTKINHFKECVNDNIDGYFVSFE